MTETAADKREAIVRRIFVIANAYLDQAPLDAPWEDDRELVDALKKRAGLVLPGHDLAGKFYTRLISIRDMNLEQVEHLHDTIIKNLSDMLGEDVNLLLPPPSPVPTARAAAEGGGAVPRSKAKAAPPLPEGEAAAQPPPEAIELPPDAAVGAMEFGRKMIALATDQTTTVENKLNMLDGLQPFWIEALGPGYQDMVKAVIKALKQGVQGDTNVLETAIRYVGTHSKYWNPTPGKVRP
jgi:hypothetical protein